MKASNILKNLQEKYKIERINPPPKLNMPGTGFHLKPDHKLIILGGMPGTGKSAYMSAEAALTLADQNVLVFIMTYEMHENKVVERLLCNGGQLFCDDLDDYKFTDNEIDEAVEQVEERLERIFVLSPRNIEEVHTYINAVLASPDTLDTQIKPRIVFVWDYLQRIPLRSDIEESRQRIAANLQEIMGINRAYDAQSVVLTSLNRQGYYLTSMEAFKEAGDIESDCDMALIMRIADMDELGTWKPVDKEKLNDARKAPVVPVLFSMVKNRHGAEIEFVMRFDKTRQTMHEMALDDEETPFRRAQPVNKKKAVPINRNTTNTNMPTQIEIPGMRAEEGKGYFIETINW